MAELVDASDSKSGISNDVQVRFLFWAQSFYAFDLMSKAFFVCSNDVSSIDAGFWAQSFYAFNLKLKAFLF
jgi:hypothetical protein